MERPVVDSVANSGEPERRSPWLAILKYLTLLLVASVLALLVWATLAASRGQNLVEKIAAGKKPTAPAFSLDVLWPQTATWPKGLRPALLDGKLSLAELRGWPVVLNFWASWCTACKEEAPILRAGAHAQAGKVVFLGLDVQDLSGDARGFARANGMNYVSVRDGGNSMYQAYGLTGVPESYFIDPRGRIVAHIPGAVSRTTLAQGIAAITGTANGGTLRGGAHQTPP